MAVARSVFSRETDKFGPQRTRLLPGPLIRREIAIANPGVAIATRDPVIRLGGLQPGQRLRTPAQVQ